MPEFLPKGERKSVKEYKVPSAAPDFTKTPPEGGSGEPSTKETADETADVKSKAQQDEEDLQALFESLENSSTEELPR